MLQLIIDAYEKQTKNEFFKNLKKMDILNRMFMIIIISGLLLWIIMVFIFIILFR